MNAILSNLIDRKHTGKTWSKVYTKIVLIWLQKTGLGVCFDSIVRLLFYFPPFCKNVKERQEKYSFLLLERIACLLFPEESLILENIFFAKRNGFSKKSLVDFPGAYHFSQINSIATFFVYFSGICLNFIQYSFAKTTKTTTF